MKHTRRFLPSGAAGTDTTIKQLGELIADSQRRPRIRLTALSILERANTDSHDQINAARALWHWCRDRIAYVNDPLTEETLQAPGITLDLGAGDCDDHAALLSALAESVGLPTRLVVIGENPERMQHIYPEILAAGQWFPADTTAPGLSFGQQPATLPARKIYSSSGAPNMIGSLSSRVYPRAVLAQVKRRAVDYLSTALRSGRMSRGDLLDYSRRLDGRGPWQNSPLRKALVEAVEQVTADNYAGGGLGSPLTPYAGIGGLSDLWTSVKDAATGVYNYAKPFVATDQAGGFQVNLPDINVNTQAPPDAVRAGVSEFLQSPLTLITAGVLLFVVLRR